MFGKKQITKLSDKELLIRYKKSKDNALVGELFNRYSQFVFLVCMKYLKNQEDSKDAVMQIYEKLFVDLLKHEVVNFKSWLHIVTRNFCLLKIRSQKSTSVINNSINLDDTNELADDFDLSQTDFLIEKEKKIKNLENAIQQLNEQQKICIKLFYFDEKCYNEISETTGYSLKKVKSYIQNGKRNLKMKLQHE